jgi:hypothetical protein
VPTTSHTWEHAKDGDVGIYQMQNVAVQKCLIDHGAEVDWIANFDTDEMWSSDTHQTLASYLQTVSEVAPLTGSVVLCKAETIKAAVRPQRCPPSHSPGVSWLIVHTSMCGLDLVPRALHRKYQQGGHCQTPVYGSRGMGYLDHTSHFIAN